MGEKKTDSGSNVSQSPGEEEKELLHNLASVFDKNDDDKVTLSDFMKIAEDLSKGELPKPKLLLDENTLREYKKASFIDKV